MPRVPFPSLFSKKVRTIKRIVKSICLVLNVSHQEHGYFRKKKIIFLEVVFM